MKIRPLLLNEVVAKGTFTSKVCPPIFAVVHVVMHKAPKKQHCARGELTNETTNKLKNRHHLLHKQVMTRAALQNHSMRASIGLD